MLQTCMEGGGHARPIRRIDTPSHAHDPFGRHHVRHVRGYPLLTRREELSLTKRSTPKKKKKSRETLMSDRRQALLYYHIKLLLIHLPSSNRSADSITTTPRVACPEMASYWSVQLQADSRPLTVSISPPPDTDPHLYQNNTTNKPTL